MAKTYILEPTSVNLSFMDGSQFSGIIGNDTSITDGIELGTILEISGNKLICGYADKDERSWGFTLNGDTSDGAPGAGMYIDGVSTVKITGGGLPGVESDGSYMVSIYTESEDSSEDSSEFKPITREEMYLAAIAGIYELPSGMTPITRKEILYQKILDKGNSESDDQPSE